MSTDLTLESVLLVLALSVGVVALFHRIRLPAIAGFILVGILVGPHGISLIGSVKDVEALAKLGVVLLLFSIGLEFSISRLRRIWRVLLEAGIPYVLIASGGAYLIARFLGLSPAGAIFTGFWVALSSTAIVLKTLSDRGEIDTPYGRLVLSILLFQDLCIVPMMLLLPVLGGTRELWGARVGEVLGEALLILLAVLFISRFVVPPFLAYVARSRNRELFLLFVLLFCLGTAGAAHWLGLSAALGAFLGGLLLSKSDYGLQALSDILPFRDVFNSIFFMSIGMLLDVSFCVAHPLPVLLAGFGLFAGKAIIGASIAMVIGFSARVAALSGLALANVGEFSFVLAGAGRELGLVPEETFQILLAASILTMAFTPVVIALAPRFARRVERVARIAPGFLAGRRSDAGAEPLVEKMREHVVVVGYGLNGSNLAHLLKAEGIPYIVLDLNATTVQEARAHGEPILFGDITSETVMKHLGLERARMLMISISDAEATRRAVRALRERYPDLHLLVRTRYVSEVDGLHALGASEVVPEEFETSIEIGARTLARYGADVGLIRGRLESLRADSYRAMRPEAAPARAGTARSMAMAGGTAVCPVLPAGSMTGLSLAEVDVPGRTGGRVLAVRRGDEILTDPNPALVLEEEDLLIVLGTEEQLDAVRALLAGEITIEEPEGIKTGTEDGGAPL
ncbi:MAG: potassium transporter KefB [Candidatus Eisenbacteria bacterium]|nr:potassium transporter KefB [Candidatus Eisenbacteria bacterium]